MSSDFSSSAITSIGSVVTLGNIVGAFHFDGMLRIGHFILAVLVGLGTLYFLRRKDRRDQEKHLLLMEQTNRLMREAKEPDEG